MLSLLGWLLFGLVAVVEVGALPTVPDNEWHAALIIACGLICAACVLVRVVGASRRGRASELALPWMLSLLGLAASWWWLHQPEPDPRWTATAAAAVGLFSASLLLFTIGILMSGIVRLRHAAALRRRRKLSARHDRVDRMGLPIDSLPPRPPI